MNGTGSDASPSPDTNSDWGGSFRYKNLPHLNVVVQYGHSVALRDNEDTPNPYLQMKCGETEFKTTAARKTIEPTWDEAFTFLINVVNGIPQETLEVELWDKHVFHKDVIIGVGKVDLKKLHRAVPTEIDVEIQATKSKVRSGVIVLRLTAVNFGDKLFDNAKEDRYTVVNFIAKDKLGPVFLVQDLIEQSKEKYLIRLNFNHLGGALAALRDLWPIRYLRHRNVIECEDLFIIQRGDENLEIAYLLYFVTNEFWQSDLSTMLAWYVKRGKTLSPHYVRMCILQIAYALSYMHKLSIVHGEVRATNILLMGQGRILLNTFTNTRVYGTSSDTHFRAPEALQKNAVLSKASDMFSLGVLVYEMVTLIKKVEHATLVTKEDDGVYAEGLAQEVLRTNGDELLANLIRDLIRTNPTQRITAEQVIDRLDNTRYIKLATVWVTGKFSDVLVIHSK